MKALKEMNNTEKAYLLAKLFPDMLKELVAFVQEEIEHQRKHEKQLRQVWPESLFTVDAWFEIIQSVERVIAHFGVDLQRSSRIFSDHLFQGHNSVFAIHCLIRYLEKNNCPEQFKYAIQLLFGEDALFVIEIDKP